LGNADIALFSLAVDTCTPATIDQCEQARSMADDCLAQYNPSQYSDLDERLSIYDQYSACVTASKVDSCR
jgi:hypothetical protein